MHKEKLADETMRRTGNSARDDVRAMMARCFCARHMANSVNGSLDIIQHMRLFVLYKGMALD